MTYNGTEHDIDYENDGKSVVVLGSGAYRIGSSVEFDWCSVNALMTVAKEGWRSVMINYNPETVSTDYNWPTRFLSWFAFAKDIDVFGLLGCHPLTSSPAFPALPC